jgi:hypothetical protein
MKIKTTQWTTIRRDRQYLPPQLAGSREAVSLQLESLLDNHLPSRFIRIEAMTDQIDVYIRNRKVAVYMA